MASVCDKNRSKGYLQMRRAIRSHDPMTVPQVLPNLDYFITHASKKFGAYMNVNSLLASLSRVVNSNMTAEWPSTQKIYSIHSEQQ